MKNVLEKMYFSQNSLEIFSQCRMKFKKRYLDGLYWRNWTPDSEDLKRLEKGRLFHLYAYRYALGLDTQAGCRGEDDGCIAGWLDKLKRFLKAEGGSPLFPEFELKISEDIMRLQAKFDLIALNDDGRVTIYDWKVQGKPLNRKRLEQSYQTILYRYLLTRAGETVKGTPIKPEDISMVYWQPEFPDRPVRITYSTSLFEEDDRFIRNQIQKIMECDFTSLILKTTDERICKHCEFCSICNHYQPEQIAYDGIEPELEWEEIEEIEF